MRPVIVNRFPTPALNVVRALVRGLTAACLNKRCGWSFTRENHCRFRKQQLNRLTATSYCNHNSAQHHESYLSQFCAQCSDKNSFVQDMSSWSAADLIFRWTMQSKWIAMLLRMTKKRTHCYRSIKHVILSSYSKVESAACSFLCYDHSGFSRLSAVLYSKCLSIRRIDSSG